MLSAAAEPAIAAAVLADVDEPDGPARDAVKTEAAVVLSFQLPTRDCRHVLDQGFLHAGHRCTAAIDVTVSGHRGPDARGLLGPHRDDGRYLERRREI